MRTLGIRIRNMFQRTGFWIGFTAVMLLCMVNTVWAAVQNMRLDITQVARAQQVFILWREAPLHWVLEYVYIFLLLLPYAFSYKRDVKLKAKACMVMRTGVRSYYYGSLLICFIGTFVMFFVPFLIENTINAVLFPMQYYLGFGAIDSGVIFKTLYAEHPLIYNLLCAGMFSAFSGLMSCFVLSISFWFNRHSLLLLLPLLLLVYVQNQLELASEAVFLKRLDLEMFEYIIADGGYGGRSAAYIAGMVIFFAAAAFVLTEIKCRHDQIN